MQLGMRTHSRPPAAWNGKGDLGAIDTAMLTSGDCLQEFLMMTATALQLHRGAPPATCEA